MWYPNMFRLLVSFDLTINQAKNVLGFASVISNKALVNLMENTQFFEANSFYHLFHWIHR